MSQRRPHGLRPRAALHSLPTQLTLLRLFSVPVIWGFALLGHPSWVAWGIIVAGMTDVLDGPIARATGATSRLGSALDTVADLSLAVSTILWLVLLRPGFGRAHWPELAIWSATGIAVLAVGWVRFRRIGDLHLYSAKAAGPVAYLFAVCLLFNPRCDVRLFYVALGLASLAQLEMLLVFLTRREVDEHGGSILVSARRMMNGARARRTPPPGPRPGDSA